MKTFNRLFSFVLAVSMMLALVGCGTGGGNEPAGSLPNDDSSVVSGDGAGPDSSTPTDDGQGEELIDPNATTLGTDDGNSTTDQDGNDTTTTGQDGNDTTTTGQVESNGKTTGNGGKVTTTTKAPTPSYTIASNQEKKFASLKGTTISVMLQTRLNEDTQEIIDVMKNKYGVKEVKTTILSYLDMQNKIAAMVASKTAPDICYFSEVLGMRYVYTNIIQPVDKYIDKADPAWDYHGSTLLYGLKGQTYGMMTYLDQNYYVYYNKTLFKELGITDPYELYKAGKWNFKTFRETAKAATIKKGGETTCYGLKTWNPTVFMMANGATGVSIDSNNKWSVSLSNDKAAMEALQLVRDMAADGSYVLDGNGYVDFYKRGCAMHIERPWNAIGIYEYYSRMKDEIGMVPVPQGEQAKGVYAPCGRDGLAVPMNCQNPLGGVAWIYELNRAGVENEKSTDPKKVAEINRTMSPEHRKIRDAYVAKARPLYSNMDGLAGWWDGEQNRSVFWNKFIVDKTQPTAAVDSLESLLTASLKKTVGSTNVKK